MQWAPLLAWGASLVTGLAVLRQALGARCALLPSGDRCTLRRPSSKDLPELLQMIKQLAEDEGAQGGSSMIQVTAQQLNRDWHDRCFDCILAENHRKELVGFALFAWGYSTWTGKLLALDDLFVVREHRGAGVGMALLRELVRLTRAAGAGRVQWMSLRQNEAANGFYERRVQAQRQDDIHLWKLEEAGMENFLASLASDSE